MIRRPSGSIVKLIAFFLGLRHTHVRRLGAWRLRVAKACPCEALLGFCVSLCLLPECLLINSILVALGNGGQTLKPAGVIDPTQVRDAPLKNQDGVILDVGDDVHPMFILENNL